MIIQVARLLKGEQELEGEYDPVDFGLPIDEESVLRVTAPIHYEVTACLADRELLVTGRLVVQCSMLCRRCATRFSATVTEPAFAANREIVDFTAEVDLTDEAREATFLALPTHPLCRTDCLGLCTQCGANLNDRKCNCGSKSDTRWSCLEGLELN